MLKTYYKFFVLVLTSINISSMEQPVKMDIQAKNIESLPDELLFNIFEDVIMSSSKKLSDIPKQYTKLKVNKRFKNILEDKNRSTKVEELDNLVCETKKFLRESHDFVADFHIACNEPNANKNKALLKSAEKGYNEIVKILINNGANVNYKNRYDDWTALHSSAFKAHIETSRLLINSHANVNAKCNCGKTPLHLAAGNNNLEIVRLLINSSANVNEKNSSNFTPIDFASPRRIDIAKLLVENGADLTVADNDEKTKLTLVKNENRKKIAKLLKNKFNKKRKIIE